MKQQIPSPPGFEELMIVLVGLPDEGGPTNAVNTEIRRNISFPVETLTLLDKRIILFHVAWALAGDGIEPTEEGERKHIREAMYLLAVAAGLNNAQARKAANDYIMGYRAPSSAEEEAPPCQT